MVVKLYFCSDFSNSADNRGPDIQHMCNKNMKQFYIIDNAEMSSTSELLQGDN